MTFPPASIGMNVLILCTSSLCYNDYWQDDKGHENEYWQIVRGKYKPKEGKRDGGAVGMQSILLILDEPKLRS